MTAAPAFEIYQRVPGLVLGFHGCDESVGEDVLQGATRHLNHSSNDYDWLGRGIYFWENDPNRAWEFAEEASRATHLTKGSIRKPFVLGAVIDLGLCLNLQDRKGLQEVENAYELLAVAHDLAGGSMPQNKGDALAARYLDCAVLEFLHSTREVLNKRKGSVGNYPPYDTTRAAFPEDDPLYDGAGFRRKNHVQISVRNVACIKGYFRPIPG